ncbi:hypothetical protein [Nocardiopsis alba]|uniref:Putative lipoprotein n=1 Tax=Nocardiopsis alba (strain ATCC BAA-2165 / BE74) TaxID=1205910 RepID=J7L657_NOCAA|nr:hypothetical protein [Nocardiopsis alba]AFR09093.1 putative lipoprotein [Nocardiopsis alba ATCC BAA-2165]
MGNFGSSVRWAAVGLSAVFVLTSCSSSGVEFDFTEPLMEPAETIRFRVPDELVEMDQEYAERRLLDSVTISATEAEDPSECAVRYEFGYTDELFERLVEFSEQYYDERPPQDAAYYAFTRVSADGSEMEEDYSSAVVQVKCALSPSDDENTVEVRLVNTFDDGDVSLGASAFVKAEVSVMQSGELFIQNYEVDGWQLDSNGNWVKG